MASPQAASRCVGLRALALLLFISLPAHGQVVKHLETVFPRDYGYVIGDKLEHRTMLTLSAPYSVDQASLPKAGRLNRWLELFAPTVDVQRHGDDTRYVIGFTYLLVNAPARFETVVVPQADFLVSDGERVQSASVPAWSFTIAPLTTALSASGQAFPALQADRPPAGPELASHYRRVALAATLLAALLMALIYERWLVPLIDRRRRPFAAAYRELRRLPLHDPDGQHYATGLRRFHTALNETAGRAVFAHALGEFFDQHPRFEKLRPDVTALFQSSQTVFFGRPGPAPAATATLKPLLLLCRRCRDIERALQ